MHTRVFAAAALVVLAASAAPAQVVLYRQGFEQPTGWVNDGGDVNIVRTVDQLYGGQPAGFTFSQNFTVETLRIGGTEAFGVGYRDPSGRGGRYALGMLTGFPGQNDDLLGLAFDVGNYRYLNFRLDISSIDLDRFGGPFVPLGGLAPKFRFSLYDNPSGNPVLGGAPTPLSFVDVVGTVGPNRYTFDFTNVVVALDAAGNTNGNVILLIDELDGSYGVLDNFVIAAANQPGAGVGVVPEPGTWAMLAAGLGVIAGVRLRERSPRVG